MSAPAFTAQAFELLEAISLQPTASFYLANKAAFKEHVEQPMQSLMRRAAEQLPGLMQSRLETQRNVFSRFLKNDFGRGGAWANYWGAFYPKGSRRLADVQLAVWMNRQRVHISFYIGDYAAGPRERFERNLDRCWPLLPELLAHLFQNPRIRLAREGRTTLDEQGYLVPEQPMTWDEWLEDPAAGHYWAFLPLRPADVLRTPGDELVHQVAQTFSDLFPLALLAMEENPLPLIRAFLGLIS